ncbi:hypothetical protein [Kitasatospora sp. NPDC056731]|uniref:hypothetical protein n=1 Tax=Kitasatospora sp. NPDC056731 TaxID=3155422 RepID=UPI0034329AF6
MDERVRQERLRRRTELGTLSSWQRREGPNAAESSRVYRAFGLLRVDGTDRTPDEVARSIADTVRSSAPIAPRKAIPHDRK